MPKGSQEPIEAIRDTIRSLVRSGANDAPECTRIAKRTLADLFRLTQRQADRLWNEHAPKPAPKEIYTLN
jgi:hypothetical protein